MAVLDTLLRLTTGRAIPSRQADQTEKLARGGTYGEAHVLPVQSHKYNLADEGTYFVTAYNAVAGTPGAGVAENAVSTAFSDTRGFIVINNPDTAVRVYLDYIKLILLGTPPTATVAQHFAGKKSTKSREASAAANRSVGTPVGVASTGGAAVARIQFWTAAAAMTVPASDTGDPVVFQGTIPTGIGIAGDEYVLRFGAIEDGGQIPGLTATRATAPARMVGWFPPVILEPKEWLVIHRWWATEATNAPTFAAEVGHWER